MSKDINNKLEVPFLENHRKISFKTTDLLKTNFKEKYFETIILDAFWNYVPFEAETKILNKIAEILHEKGKVLLAFRISLTLKQEWKDLKTGETLLPYFSKLSSFEDLEKAASGLSLNAKQVYNDGNYGIAELKFE